MGEGKGIAPPPVLFAGSAPVVQFASLPRKFIEGARNAGAQAPHDPVHDGFRCTGGSRHGVPERPAFRARCLRLAPRDPRWAVFRGRPLHRQDRPPHRAGDHGSAWRSVRAVRHCRRRSPPDAQQAHRDPAAWAAVRALRTPKTRPPHQPRGSRPFSPKSPTPYLRRRLPAVPALERPRARPRMGRGGRHIGQDSAESRIIFRASSRGRPLFVLPGSTRQSMQTSGERGFAIRSTMSRPARNHGSSLCVTTENGRHCPAGLRLHHFGRSRCDLHAREERHERVGAQHDRWRDRARGAPRAGPTAGRSVGVGGASARYCARRAGVVGQAVQRGGELDQLRLDRRIVRARCCPRAAAPAERGVIVVPARFHADDVGLALAEHAGGARPSSAVRYCRRGRARPRYSRSAI